MTAPDPRVTLTEAEREALGDWWDDPADLGLNHLYPVVERIVAERLAARLAPIRAVIDGPIGTHKERPDEYGAWYRGARHLRVALRRALDAPSEAPSGPESAQQGSGGAEGRSEDERAGEGDLDGFEYTLTRRALRQIKAEAWFAGYEKGNLDGYFGTSDERAKSPYADLDPYREDPR